MTLVLVILAIVWIAVLLPPALRARAEGRPADSISAFRRQLTVLRRARPGDPRVVRRKDWAPSDVDRSRPPAPNSVALAGPSRGRSARTSHAPRSVRPLHPAPSTGAARLAKAPGAATTNRTRKRRRDVFLALLTASGATLVLGLIPSLRVMLLVNLVADALLLAYVALLVRQRNLAAERDMKVRFLPRPRTIEPALLRRSVN